MYLPEINGDCIMCGKCTKVCPSVDMKYDVNNNEIESYVLGDIKAFFAPKAAT